MRKFFLLLAIFMSFYGCFHLDILGNNKEDDYSNTEINLSQFSKKLTHYYASRNETIPKDFNEKIFFIILEDIYPDKDAVKSIKNTFKVKARSLGNYYSVMLCNPDNGRKLMEDFSCSIKKVDVSYWNGKEVHSCEFEQDWQRYCD